MSDSTISRVYHDLDLYLDDDIAQLNNPLPAQTRVKPSFEWLEFLFTTRRILDPVNEFICVHNKFYWKTCTKCNRSPEGAKYWKAKLWPRLEALLSAKGEHKAKTA